MRMIESSCFFLFPFVYLNKSLNLNYLTNHVHLESIKILNDSLCIISEKDLPEKNNKNNNKKKKRENRISRAQTFAINKNQFQTETKL